MFPDAVLVEIVAGSFAILSVILGNEWRKANTEKRNQEAEIRFQSAALSFEDFLLDWGEIDAGVRDLFEKTNVDRFLLLRAWNGHSDPKWTTAFFQIRDGIHEPVSYVHFELDDDYVNRLMQIKSRGMIHFSSADLPESAIKRVYDLEKVKSSAWFFLDRRTLEGTNSSAITYCSFASHSAGELSQDEITKAQIIVSRIKGLLANEATG